MALNLTPPAPIASDHELEGFDSGVSSLDEWLKKRALKNHAAGASRCCFVLCNSKAVIGYYSLSAGAISHEAAPKPMRRNMPNPLPVLLLGGSLSIGVTIIRGLVRRCCAMRCCEPSAFPAMLACSLSRFTPFLIPPSSFTCHAASWNLLCSP